MAIFSKLFSRFFKRDSSPPPPRPGPTSVAVQHVSTFLRAVKEKDKDIVIKLFNATKGYKKKMNNFIDVHQGIEIHVESAVYTRKGDIDVKLRFSDVNTQSKIRAQWLLTACPESPTGWKVMKISQSRFTLQMFFKM